MLTPTRENIKVDGDLQSVARIQMRFDENAIVHLMSLLTDLYSNPESSVVREYSCNALDSHIAAGQTKPIEITTPSNLSQFFKIKDYGVGLGLDDIQNVFSLYGSSTKRETNDQTGCLGIGAKSALAYSNSFTLTGVKDGVKTFVSISRDAEGAGVMEVIDTTPTNEPNGVEVVIPTKLNNSINHYCKEFFKFWEAGTVLVDGKAPERFEGKQVAPNLYITSEKNNDYVVMGGVAYPVNKDYFGGYRYYSVVAFVGMGEVFFTPSREELQYNKITVAKLEEIKKSIDVALKNSVQKDITDSKTYGEAMHKYYEWDKMLSNKYKVTEFKYKDQVLPGRFDTKDTIVYDLNAYRNTVHRPQYVGWNMVANCLFVNNFGLADITGSHKSKLKYYCTQNNLSVRYIIISSTKTGFPWTNDLPTVDWSVVSAIKVPRATGAGGSQNSGPREDYQLLGGDEIDGSKIDKTKPVYYYSPRDFEGYSQYDCEIFNQVLPDNDIFIVHKNRIAKFLRYVPNAQHVLEPIKTIAKDLDMTYTDKVQALGPHWDYKLNSADSSKVDDPALKESIVAVKTANKTAKSNNVMLFRNLNTVAHMNYSVKIKAIELEDPLKDYPLWSNYHLNHSYVYANAIYKAGQSVDTVVQ